MSLAFGREFVSIPGPSVMPDRVLAAMARPAPNIYAGAIMDRSQSILADLKRVAGAAGDVAIYIANGHGAWEAAVSNTFSRGDLALVCNSGRFGQGWADLAAAMGVRTEMMDSGFQAPTDPAALEARLKADTNHKIKAVLTVQVDTASSVLVDIPAMRRAIDAAGHPAMLMVDTIACLGCIPFEMDAWGVDINVTGSQKGLMTPPGVSFVYMSDKAKAARENADLVTSYWDWKPRIQPDIFYQLFCGTAPTQHLFALREALDMMFEEGLEHVFARHRIHAAATRAAVQGWAEGGALELNIANPAHQSDVVTTVRTPGLDSEELQRIARDEMGLVLGVGLGFEPGEAFRIGHMGWLNPPMLMGTLGATEAALAHMGAPHGHGLAAAAQVIADNLTI